MICSGGAVMIALIVAYSENRVIGNHGVIPWNITGEQTRFKKLTTGNVVIMGRRTFEEIGKPLPNRTTIVISSTKQYEYDNCFTCSTLSEVLQCVQGQDIYISGGAALYREAIDLVDKMYITIIEKEIEGDTYFPGFDERQFKKQVNERYEAEIPYTNLTYTRI
jgi:dihydrofolate reductase